MNWFKKILKIVGPRAIGVGAGLLSGLIVAKTGGAVNITPEKIVAIAGTMLGTYAGGHRVASVFLNPGDAAVPALVQVDEDVQQEVKNNPPIAPPSGDYSKDRI